MPVYSFKCEVCDKEDDYIRSFIDTPECCGQRMRRLFTVPSLITVYDSGGTRTYSKDYKDDYAKQYRESIGIET